MSRGHHFTRCHTCNKEYVCGDCITTDCEMGRDKRKCPEYQNHIRKTEAAAKGLTRLFTSSNPKQAAMARLLAGHHYDDLCKELTNAELADALKHTVWAHMKIGTKEIALMEQAIDRLEGKA